MLQPGVVTFPIVAFHAQYGAPGCGWPSHPWPWGPTRVGCRPVWHAVWFVMRSHDGHISGVAAVAATRPASARRRKRVMVNWVMNYN